MPDSIATVSAAVNEAYDALEDTDMSYPTYLSIPRLRVKPGQYAATSQSPHQHSQPEYYQGSFEQASEGAFTSYKIAVLVFVQIMKEYQNNVRIIFAVFVFILQFGHL